jgi:acetyl-CoA carboxylase biotin carboxyl carrier protein
MDPDTLKTCIDAMAASDLAEMTFQKDGWTLRLCRGAAPRPAAAQATAPIPNPAILPRPKRATPADAEIRAPLSGVVHLRPAPDRPEFVSAGLRIAPGAVVCLVEAMKTFLEVRAERGGLVDAILVASGDEVEFGQSLVRMG